MSELHCHYCVRWVGDTSQALVFVGMFKDPHDRYRLSHPRDTYRCKSCGWVNIFRPREVEARDYRSIELKAS